MTVADAKTLMASGALGAGSMKPKVEAAVSFVESGGGRATIAALKDGHAAVRGEAGTTITTHDARLTTREGRA
jgi:carbamate kinase